MPAAAGRRVRGNRLSFHAVMASVEVEILEVLLICASHCAGRKKKNYIIRCDQFLWRNKP